MASSLLCQAIGTPLPAVRRTGRTARPFKPTARSPIAERGGESVTADTGNVYVANGQIFVYDPADRMIGEIDVPERPIDILFGGPDRWTLFILGHHTLYAVKTRAFGEPFAWVK
jgi:sugar lactone lactonase YvrE